MIRRTLPADTDVFALGQTCLNRLGQQDPDGRVALIKIRRQQFHAGVTVQSQRELRQVVGAY